MNILLFSLIAEQQSIFEKFDKNIAQYVQKKLLFEGLIEQPKRNFARGRNG